ncbi:MAG: UvrB/UvrC motif-containing protein [Nocardioidaceae bacterium]
MAPCDGSVTDAEYAGMVVTLRRALVANPSVVVESISRRMELLARAERFEEAASHRNRMTSFLRAAVRVSG